MLSIFGLEEAKLVRFQANLSDHVLNLPGVLQLTIGHQIAQQEVASSAELWLGLYGQPLQRSQGCPAAGQLRRRELVISSDAISWDVNILKGLDVGVLVHLDLDKTIRLPDRGDVRACVAVTSTLDTAPLVCSIDALADGLPLRAVHITNTVEVVNVSSHCSKKTRKLTSGVQLGLAEPQP